MTPFSAVGEDVVYESRLLRVARGRFRAPDGSEFERDVVHHPGWVAVVPLTEDGHVVCVRQYRAALDELLLEIPAGKLDEAGEDPLKTAQRELAEEIGKRAESWRHLTTYYSSAGFTDEEVHLYLATELSDESAESDEEERIEIREVPLADLDETIDACKDAKTLLGLLWFRAFLRGD